MIKVILNGCCGKMGKTVTELSKDFPNIEIVAGVDKFLNKKYNYKIFSSINEIDFEYDVLLDFSRPESLEDLLTFSVAKKKPIILCTTGYNKKDLELIEEKSKLIPIFKSANMSLGINLINSLLKKIVPVLYKNFDIEIIEKHHNQKVDSPSGTALQLANTIKNSLSKESSYIYGRYGSKKRTKEEIGIHSIRGGSIVGEHEIIFAGTGEVIEISHKAISREVFAIGALKACEFMASINIAGLYNMDNLLKI
ncbi:4-hydroxy-tetrahydrodipicolinate reductase [Clostridium isatidis]|uniref:4-hydroxy-tetrahydrodipicolinate reductase n=1 Tax=Clostridium isatidis TaxID=182773 RepID=A0A343JAQ8_9CLOT|nr:4-hydroxy-tetrahydrodipicolinate reductase [Clostridium isatidis]ASW42616.1 4-hydroxy-tetrahydrodipicolinate reductase [Clostridium isatidis]